MKIKQMMASVGILVLAALCVARAEDTFPSRQISLIVPNAPGGGMDTVARLLAKKLSEALSKPIIVENRPGGAENIGINAGAKAAPDGYTLLLSSNSITINPSLFKHLNYDASKDLLPIGKVTSLPMLIVCSPSAPYKTLLEFIAYAKGNPGKLSYGSPGTGTPHHLAMELLKSAAGIDVLHVPYKGTAPGLTDLLGDTIPLLVTTIAPAAAYLQSGRLRILATLSPTRLDQFPDVPAVGETIPGFGVDVWHGVFAPTGTPPAIAAKLTKVLEGVVKDPDLSAQLTRIGVVPAWAPPSELHKTIEVEQAQWAVAIKKAGIEPQ